MTLPILNFKLCAFISYYSFPPPFFFLFPPHSPQEPHDCILLGIFLGSLSLREGYICMKWRLLEVVMAHHLDSVALSHFRWATTWTIGISGRLCFSILAPPWPTFSLYSLSVFFFFFFLGPHPWYMEVPGRGWIRAAAAATATATVTLDLSHVFDLHCSSWQHQIINPLSGPRDQTCILMDTLGSVTTEPQGELPTFNLLHPLPDGQM